MEIKSKITEDGQDDETMNNFFGNMGVDLSSDFLKDIINSIPGIDEAIAFGELLKTIDNQDTDCIVFDTAPTGHTLRFLNFPNTIEKLLSKLLQLKDKFEPMMRMAMGMAQSNVQEGQPKPPSFDEIVEKINKFKEYTDKAIKQFKDHEATTFVAVCIPEFLSLYETERLIQELTNYEIDIHNIVVNQLVTKKKLDQDKIKKEIENSNMSDDLKNLTFKAM